LTLTEQQAGVMYAGEWWTEKLDFVVLLGCQQTHPHPETKVTQTLNIPTKASASTLLYLASILAKLDQGL
jgi:hypothetical protein